MKFHRRNSISEPALFLQLLITDMAANSHRIDDIDDMANKMVRGRHLKTQLIKKKQADINDKWVLGRPGLVLPSRSICLFCIIFNKASFYSNKFWLCFFFL